MLSRCRKHPDAGGGVPVARKKPQVSGRYCYELLGTDLDKARNDEQADWFRTGPSDQGNISD